MKKTILLFSLCASLLTACDTIGLGSTPTPTADRAATADAQATLDVQSTERIQATVDAVYAAAEAEVTEAALTKEAMIPTPTRDPDILTQRAQAEQSFEIVESLYDAGFISTTKGENLPLDRFLDNIAKINYFTWTFTGHFLSDFVFKSDIEWQSASDISNWFDAGCGIVFREDGTGNSFYVVFLYLDGYAVLRSYDDGNWRRLAESYYGKLEIPDGGAELIVTAEGDHIQVFVNSKLVIDDRDERYSDGEFGYTVVSGTNKGFGTRCIFDNSTLWELDIED